MERKLRSQSVDVGALRPRQFDSKSLGITGRQSLDFGNRYNAGRQSIDVGRGRRTSRASVDVGARRHLSYDAWIRAVRVSHQSKNSSVYRDIHKFFLWLISHSHLWGSRHARQRIHAKHQAFFLRKIKLKIIKCRLLQILFGALRVMILD